MLLAGLSSPAGFMEEATLTVSASSKGTLDDEQARPYGVLVGSQWRLAQGDGQIQSAPGLFADCIELLHLWLQRI